MKKLLEEKSKEIGIVISKKQLDQFEKYYDHLIETNKVMNLTTIVEEEDVVLKHFIDSISIINYVEFKDKDMVIDVGTGAGFPGIPLAILLPNVSFTLMDSLNKRIKFLDQVISLCDLKNVKTIHSRAEELGKDKLHREKYNYCVSRAVANISVLLEYTIPFVKVGGQFISYKADHIEEELKNSSSAQQKLCCTLNRVEEFQLSNGEIQRTFLIFDKRSILNKMYPRQAGMPKKNPL